MPPDDGTTEVETTQVETTTVEGTDTLLTGEQNLDSSDKTGDVDTTGEGTGETEKEGSQTAPETYADFSLSENTLIDEAALAEATPLFKEMGLNQDQAQKLVEFYDKQIQAGSQKQMETFNQLMDDWRTQSKNDKEFGGDKFDENVKLAKSAIDKYGTSELKALLEDHGVGNHPEVVRFMVRVGATLKEDLPGGSSPVSAAQDRVSILYPTNS